MVTANSARWRRLTSVVLCISVLHMTACATVDPSLSADEQKLQESNQRFYETVATGALVLGLIGAGLGAAAGGGRGALIGAGAGLAAGAAAGWAVGAVNQNYASREDDLRNQVNHAVALHNKYLEDVALSERIVAANTQKIALLRSQVATKAASVDQYSAELRRQQGAVAEMNKSLQENGKRIAELKDDNSKRVAKGVRSPEYAQAISSYENLYKRQETALSTLLAAQREPVPVS